MAGNLQAWRQGNLTVSDEFGKQKLDAMIRIKKDRAVGGLDKINYLQRRDAQACYFEGRAVLNYEMLKVLPESG